MNDLPTPFEYGYRVTLRLQSASNWMGTCYLRPGDIVAKTLLLP